MTKSRFPLAASVLALLTHSVLAEENNQPTLDHVCEDTLCVEFIVTDQDRQSQFRGFLDRSTSHAGTILDTLGQLADSAAVVLDLFHLAHPLAPGASLSFAVVKSGGQLRVVYVSPICPDCPELSFNQLIDIAPFLPEELRNRYGTYVDGDPLSAQQQRPTPANTNALFDRYDSLTGGVLLESQDADIPVNQVHYISPLNLFVVDSQSYFFPKIPPKEVREIFHSVALDDRLGATLLDQDTQLYGELPVDGRVAQMLLVGDMFLSALVFGLEPLVSMYTIPGQVPLANVGDQKILAVFIFESLGFDFTRDQIESRGIDVKIMLIAFDDVNLRLLPNIKVHPILPFSQTPIVLLRILDTTHRSASSVL